MGQPRVAERATEVEIEEANPSFEHRSLGTGRWSSGSVRCSTKTPHDEHRSSIGAKLLEALLSVAVRVRRQTPRPVEEAILVWVTTAKRRSIFDGMGGFLTFSSSHWRPSCSHSSIRV